MASLRVISGPRAGEQIEVDHEIVIGRAGADVIIEDAELSRRHLGVRPDGDLLVIEDLGSTNGTFVDDRRIAAPMHVSDGTRVKLGSTVFEVSIAEAAQATRVAAAAPSDTEKTSLRTVAAAATAAAAAPLPVPAPAAPPLGAGQPLGAPATAAVQAPPPSTIEVGAFSVSHKRRGGLASRSWIPVVLSFGTVILVAVALVIYFATRTT